MFEVLDVKSTSKSANSDRIIPRTLRCFWEEGNDVAFHFDPSPRCINILSKKKHWPLGRLPLTVFG